VDYIPVVNVGYKIVKRVVGGLLLGIAKRGAVIAEGGTDGKVSSKEEAEVPSFCFETTLELIFFPLCSHDGTIRSQGR